VTVSRKAPMAEAGAARGPIGCPPELRSSLVDLIDEVFRPGMEAAFPHLLAEENLENCRVTVADGKVVSHIGYIVSDVTILGAPLRVACLGAVGTLEACRGQGYATAEFTDCLRRMESQGVHLLMVSGGRSLYQRNHCMRVGRDFGCSIDAGDAAGLAGGATIEPIGRERIDEVIEIQRLEPVRFVRTRELWLQAVDWLADSWRAGEVLGISTSGGGALAAYVIVVSPNDKGWLRVMEYGGSRAAIAAALGAIIERTGAKTIGLHVPGWDAQMLALLRSAGQELSPASSSGTQRIVNFRELMERLRPVLAERAGAKTAAALEFGESGGPDDGEFTVRLGDSELVIPDRDVLVKLLFGTQDDEERGVLSGSPAAEALGRCLPVPALNYGISYV